MFVDIIIRNVLAHIFKHEVFEPTVDVLGSVALPLFLAMVSMSLKFDQLASMTGPVLIIIAVQTVIIVLFILFACFVIFRIMGKYYDAVVINAGHCGFGMRATVIANMQTVTKAFSPSHKAFLVVPMVCAFIVNISNSILIKIFIEIDTYVT